jgi:hypothetical protein
MLLPKNRTAADYRLQAAHIREFLQTVHDDGQLRAVLLDAVERLDRLADEGERSGPTSTTEGPLGVAI